MTLPEPLYDDGQVTLYCGDALDILPHIEGVDLMLADAPYSSGGIFRSDRNQRTSTKYRTNDSQWDGEDFAGDSRDQRSYLHWVAIWSRQAWSACRPGATLLSFIDDKNLPAMQDGVQVGGWVYRQTLTWDKSEHRARPCAGWFRKQTEFIVAATKGPILRGHGARGKVSPGVFREPSPGADRQHQTQKPLALLVELIETRDDWQIICDPFAGSGSTLLAADSLGRRAVGVELSPHFCDIAIERLHKQRERLGKVAPDTADLGQQIGLFATRTR